MVRFMLCAATLAAVVWLRPDINMGRSDLYQEMAMGDPSPMAVFYVTGQFGLLALCLFWALRPLLRQIGRWVTVDNRDPDADRLRMRMDAALKSRRTHFD